VGNLSYSFPAIRHYFTKPFNRGLLSGREGLILPSLVLRESFSQLLILAILPNLRRISAILSPASKLLSGDGNVRQHGAVWQTETDISSVGES
jgi:hypothetical protein